MIDGLFAFFEARILAWETARRGRRHAGRVEADPGFVGSLAGVAAKVGEARVVSFDIFDTLLLRRGLAPEAVERKTAGLARLIGGAGAGEAAWAARHHFGGLMKARMRDERRGDEPPLAEMFAAALTARGFRGDALVAAESLAAFETELDARSVRAAPGAVELLEGLKGRGLRLVALSDMYLTGAQVSAILEHAGLRGFFDEVFVSADLGWTKHGGRIFDLVAERVGVEPGEILHVGDRLDSDVAPARAAGWRALHLADRAAIAETEAARLAESYVPSPHLRRRRVETALDIADGRALRSPERIVDQLVGPAVAALALRALTLAQRRGAKRLFHMTRDATVVGEVAEAARARFSHFAPDGLEISELAINRALGARLQVRSAADLWKLGHLAPYLAKTPFSGETLIRAFDLPEGALSAGARAAEGAALLTLIEEPGEAGPLMAALDAGRAPVESYLESKGLLEPARSVAVDIGYSGTFGVQLSDFWFGRPADGRGIDFLFLMTSRYFNGNARRIHPAVRLHPGLALDHRRRSSRWATWNFAWVEPLLIDPARGRLMGYEGGEAVFAPSPYEGAARERLEALRTRMRERAARFFEDFHAAPGDLEEIAAILQRRFARFAGRPRRVEVAAVRALAHQTGQVEIELRDPTRRVNPFKLPAELQAMKMGDNWTQGSLARSGLGLVNLAMADRAERDRRADPRAMWD